MFCKYLIEKNKIKYMFGTFILFFLNYITYLKLISF